MCRMRLTPPGRLASSSDLAQRRAEAVATAQAEARRLSNALKRAETAATTAQARASAAEAAEAALGRAAAQLKRQVEGLKTEVRILHSLTHNTQTHTNTQHTNTHNTHNFPLYSACTHGPLLPQNDRLHEQLRTRDKLVAALESHVSHAARTDASDAFASSETSNAAAVESELRQRLATVVAQLKAFQQAARLAAQGYEVRLKW